ncbi:AbrB/MazE/SpoVT family DNA-binding domain-containing protein [Corynebacterium meitnerae]|uniref:AbrB/MazE/SpoVT family DNA-binding domain-containing protein n=1 Tax=Corynebacterium meitnerae TaxID=2913498 RepID=A0A9X3LWL1_9CORY|nr:AbrB/MazE/SpoVT family DNA-binding domain-containing protein [Corynebacterium meitnerae]MCZ9293933.1 AbrB/MazE/SpoVT family DNA-binding domain-containing protein [Corynebacterium meitnerae]
MEATIDSGGRILLPKALREALGLTPGSTVDVSAYGGGITIIPGGRTAEVVETEDGRLVGRGSQPVTDEDILALIDAGRM